MNDAYAPPEWETILVKASLEGDCLIVETQERCTNRTGNQRMGSTSFIRAPRKMIDAALAEIGYYRK